MDPQRCAHIERLYHEALGLHPNERASFLAEACGGDPELKQQVAMLLDQAATIDGFLAAPVAQIIPRAVTSELETIGVAGPGPTVGNYRIERLVGRGGMGVP